MRYRTARTTSVSSTGNPPSYANTSFDITNTISGGVEPSGSAYNDPVIWRYRLQRRFFVGVESYTNMAGFVDSSGTGYTRVVFYGNGDGSIGSPVLEESLNDPNLLTWYQEPISSTKLSGSTGWSGAVVSYEDTHNSAQRTFGSWVLQPDFGGGYSSFGGVYDTNGLGSTTLLTPNGPYEPTYPIAGFSSGGFNNILGACETWGAICNYEFYRAAQLGTARRPPRPTSGQVAT